MKRMHVHVGVDNLAQSMRFYTNLFGAEPSVVQPDYAKWMLEDPRLNFAISVGHAARGIEHLGIQVEDEAELAEVGARLARADGPVLEEAATTCCYATSSKAWIADPQGVVWETFLTKGSASDYGNSPALSRLAGDRDQQPSRLAGEIIQQPSRLAGTSAVDGACCAPAIAPAKTGCC